MTTSSTLHSLASAATPEELLLNLKDLKNSVIGNTWKKVEVAEDEEVIEFLLSLLTIPESGSTIQNAVQLEIVTEAAVIMGALANIGPLTLKPLLISSAPTRLINLIRQITIQGLPSSTLPPSLTAQTKLLAPLLRALRNVLLSTADLIWGHIWGVGAERKVVTTGLVGTSNSPTNTRGKGKEVVGRSNWRCKATRALGLVFERDTLDTLLSLIQDQSNIQVLLPLYQLLSRLTALPSHREALLHWTPQTPHTSSTSVTQKPKSTSPINSFILNHLIQIILNSSSSSSNSTKSSIPGIAGRKPNPKILEAALDLLGALVKGQPTIANFLRDIDNFSTGAPQEDVEMGMGSGVKRDRNMNVGDMWSASDERIPSSALEGLEEGKGIIDVLLEMLSFGPSTVRIAAAGCLTSIMKEWPSSSDPQSSSRDRDRDRDRSEYPGYIRGAVVKLRILDVVLKLLKGESLEEKLKLCFVLATLASDDSHMQKESFEQGCPQDLINLLNQTSEEESKGEISTDLASRSKEAILLALGSLSFGYEPTRTYIAETTPPFLPYIKNCLGHPSYGVRASACQLTRALSRTIAILRTSLVDTGIGEEVILVLKREVESRKMRRTGKFDGGKDGNFDDVREHEEEDLDGGRFGERAWTVEVAATATICNLITDFSPLRTSLLHTGGIELLCELSHSPYEPLALNALWAIKNLLYHAEESLKNQVMGLLGYQHLKKIMSSDSPTGLRTQGFEITQNLLADNQSAELGRIMDMFGTGSGNGSGLVDLVVEGLRQGDVDLQIPAFWILSNLALGNEKIRNTLVGRIEILDALTGALNAKSENIKIPALRALRHLLESTGKSRKPRQAIVDILSPYQLKNTLKALGDSEASFDVRVNSLEVLDLLNRAKDGSVGTSSAR